MDSTETTTHVGLCAGYGGIELGLKRVIPNLRTVALCEIEAFAIANLVAKMEAGLMDPAPIWPDLKTFPWESFRDRVDILTGGYPCQPFSSAGKRAGKDDPRHLWPWIADGIASMRPSICFFENVEGHISLGLSNVIEDLGRMGYRTTWGIFSAAEVGAPHQRKRVFILANRNDEGLERWNRSILSERTNERTSWPSRPSIPQYSWEPPRVVANSASQRTNNGQQLCGEECRQGRALSCQPDEPSDFMGNAESRMSGQSSTGDWWESAGRASEGGQLGNSIDRGTSTGGRIDDAEAGSAGQAMENTIRSGGEEPGAQSADLSPESSGCDTESVENTNLAVNRSKARRSKTDQPYAERSASGYCGPGEEAAHERQTESSLGRNPDGTARGMDYAKLCVSGDNRTDELRLLGNGVVPATAELAFRTLFSSLAGDP